MLLWATKPYVRKKRFPIIQTVRTQKAISYHFEMQGRMITAHINGNKVLSYLTNAGDAPKETVQFAVGGNGSEVTNGWYADIHFEPFEH